MPYQLMPEPALLHGLSQTPVSYVGSGDLLTRENLRQKMQFILSMNELVTPIDDDCLDYMQMAVEVCKFTLELSIRITLKTCGLCLFQRSHHRCTPSRPSQQNSPLRQGALESKTLDFVLISVLL